MNYILGSGLVGLIAKHILGEKWDFIPLKKSRFYSFFPTNADNFIESDSEVDDFMKLLNYKGNVIFYKRPFSVAGVLDHDGISEEQYKKKVYGEKTIPRKLKTSFPVYDLTAKTLYEGLQRKYVESDINRCLDKYGHDLLSIDTKNRIIKTSKGEFSYDNIISTIPLKALSEICSADYQFESKAVCYYQIKTKTLDLEGSDQVLVADKEILFFKCQAMSENEFYFWSFDDIDNAYLYFRPFLGAMDIEHAFRLSEVIPINHNVDFSWFSNHGITCVGSLAQWDDMMCVGSCIKRLMKLSNEL